MNPNDLRRLKYFSVVADTLSFTEAARQLNVAQPAITRAVRDLEHSLDMALMIRTTREVTLTPAGAALARGANQAWQTLDGALHQMKQIELGLSGKIVVGYSAQAAYGLMSQILLKFRNRAPDIMLQLQLHSSDELVELLLQSKIDVGFLLTLAVPHELETRHVTRESFVALVPEAHPIASMSKVPLKDLANEPFILGTMERWRMFRMMIEATCLHEGFRPRVVSEADDTPLLLEMIASGQGISLFGAPIARSLPPGIVAVPLIGKVIDFDICLAWKKDGMTPAVETLIDCSFSSENLPG